MGSYVNSPDGRDIQEWLKANAEPLHAEKSYFNDQELAEMLLSAAADAGKAVIACVDNGPFKAALIVSGWGDARAVGSPSDHRPLTLWMLKESVLEEMGHDLENIFRR
jgi:hypothetical protein